MDLLLRVVGVVWCVIALCLFVCGATEPFWRAQAPCDCEDL